TTGSAMMLDREEFLRGMRRVANSVTVVTTGGPCGRHGATVSAFCSVSADPPSVLVCLHGSSRIAAMVRHNGTFCVNVLNESAKSIADRFAGRTGLPCQDRFSGLRLVTSRHPSPILGLAATAFSCDIAESMQHGTHLIVVGRVVAVANTEANPLTYLNGRYSAISEPHVVNRS
ncbi:MAG: flavin reductase family protein, partial [Gammaproteobacteria bacterium]